MCTTLPKLLDLSQGEVNAEDALDVTTSFWQVVGFLIGGELQEGEGSSTPNSGLAHPLPHQTGCIWLACCAQRLELVSEIRRLNRC